MIHSMTAFARESQTTAQGLLTVELRTVNHRYLDLSFKLPDALKSLEPKLRERLGKVLARGKVDCQFRLQQHGESSAELQVDEEQLARLLAATAQVAAKIPGANPPGPLQILQFPGVLRPPQGQDEQLQADAADLFANALDSLAANRQREGEKLAELIRERLKALAGEVAALREAVPSLLQHQRDRVTARIAELGAEVDQGRLEQELVYMAQKADVDEELDRLETHVVEVERALSKGGPCGRRLDFLMQELNREANTLSSKSTAASTTQSAVELKVLIEQMREQIQNIE